MTQQSAATGMTYPPMVRATVRESAQPAFDQIWGAVFGEPAPSAVRTVLFTAAGRKEGVSTLVAGTAMTGANINFAHRVGLLDLNLRYPQLATLVGARAEPGLADVLAGRASLEQIAQTVGVSNLTLYPAGAAGARGTGAPLLAGQAVGELIRQIAGRHDFLLADCPPANLFPDAQILASMFDGAILVAEAGGTRRESLAEAKKRIDLGRGRVLGVVLNKRRYPVPRFLYRRS